MFIAIHLVWEILVLGKFSLSTKISNFIYQVHIWRSENLVKVRVFNHGQNFQSCSEFLIKDQKNLMELIKRLCE